LNSSRIFQDETTEISFINKWTGTEISEGSLTSATDGAQSNCQNFTVDTSFWPTQIQTVLAAGCADVQTFSIHQQTTGNGLVVNPICYGAKTTASSSTNTIPIVCNEKLEAGRNYFVCQRRSAVCTFSIKGAATEGVMCDGWGGIGSSTCGTIINYDALIAVQGTANYNPTTYFYGDSGSTYHLYYGTDNTVSYPKDQSVAGASGWNTSNYDVLYGTWKAISVGAEEEPSVDAVPGLHSNSTSPSTITPITYVRIRVKANDSEEPDDFVNTLNITCRVGTTLLMSMPNATYDGDGFWNSTLFSTNTSGTYNCSTIATSKSALINSTYLLFNITIEPPRITNISISPANLSLTDAPNCSIKATDLYNLSLQGNFSWKKDGVDNHTWDTVMQCSNNTLCWADKGPTGLTDLETYNCLANIANSYNYSNPTNISVTIKVNVIRYNMNVTLTVTPFRFFQKNSSQNAVQPENQNSTIGIFRFNNNDTVNRRVFMKLNATYGNSTNNITLKAYDVYNYSMAKIVGTGYVNLSKNLTGNNNFTYIWLWVDYNNIPSNMTAFKPRITIVGG
jgi:hypothetical protein